MAFMFSKHFKYLCLKCDSITIKYFKVLCYFCKKDFQFCKRQKMSKKKIQVEQIEISILKKEGRDYICITDIARKFSDSPNDTIKSYLRNGNNLEYMAAWEQLYNENFKTVVADRFRIESVKNSFTLSIKQWVDKTKAIGIYSTPGRYGGTYAQKDIAYQFAMWLSPVFQLFIVKEFDRLKQIEEKSQQFYLDKIFNSTLEANQLSKFLLDGQQLPDDE